MKWKTARRSWHIAGRTGPGVRDKELYEWLLYTPSPALSVLASRTLSRAESTFSVLRGGCGSAFGGGEGVRGVRHGTV